MNFKIVSGKRRNSNLLYTIDEKFLYVKKHVYLDKITYNCYEKKCGVKVIVQNNICNKNLSSKTHNHPNHENLCKELEIKNSIKRKCGDLTELLNSNSLHSNIRKIFNEECSK